MMDNETRIIINGQNNSDRAYQDATRSSDRFQQDQQTRMGRLKQMFSRAGREAGQDLGRGITETATQQLERLRAQAEQSMRQYPVVMRRVGDDAGKALGDGIKDGLKEKTDKLPDDTADKMKDGDGKMRDAGEGSGGKFGGALKAGALAAVAGLVAAVAAVGVLAGAALVKGVQGAIEQQADNSKLAAQLGLNPEQAARAGKLAGKVYSDAYGESLADVNAAIRGVSLNIGDMRKMGNADVEAMTQKALDLASAFDVDVAESTRAVGKLVKTGLAKDATEAFDMITRGFQTGVDEAGDLIDTINEYSTQFRDLGISGPKALGMMSQALKAGARDADTAADAIKEFAIRSKDGSKASESAFKELGFNSSKMFKTFAKGGPEADKAMKQVIDRLRDVKNPLDQNAIAVALFGTKAEDLQDALFAIDPTTAVAALGKVGGASKAMGDTLNDTAAGKIESFKRKINQGLTNVGAGILNWFEEISASPGARKFMDTFRKDILPIIKSAADWINKNLVPAIKDGLSKWLGKGGEAFEKLGKAIEENRPELEKLANIVKIVAKAFIDFATSDAMTSGLGFAIDMVTLLIKAIAKLEPVWSSGMRFAALFGMALIGMLGKVLDVATEKLSWVPGLGPKLKSAQEQFRKGTSAAMADLNKLYEAAKKPPEPTIVVRLDYGSANAAERWLANLARNRQSATYGRESGPGDGTGRRGGYAHGGITGAATGGARGGMTWVGEQGPELVRLPYGSTVHPAGTSREMARSGGGGGGVVTIMMDLTGADRGLLEWLRNATRIEGGGNVQLAFGKAGR